MNSLNIFADASYRDLLGCIVIVAKKYTISFEYVVTQTAFNLERYTLTGPTFLTIT